MSFWESYLRSGYFQSMYTSTHYELLSTNSALSPYKGLLGLTWPGGCHFSEHISYHIPSTRWAPAKWVSMLLNVHPTWAISHLFSFNLCSDVTFLVRHFMATLWKKASPPSCQALLVSLSTFSCKAFITFWRAMCWLVYLFFHLHEGWGWSVLFRCILGT